MTTVALERITFPRKGTTGGDGGGKRREGGCTSATENVRTAEELALFADNACEIARRKPWQRGISQEEEEEGEEEERDRGDHAPYGMRVEARCHLQ